MSIKFSVIIPCYNVSKFIHLLVNSLLKYDIKPDEIILINDCSTDNTLEVLDNLNLGETKKVIASTLVNSGPGGARNLGVEMSTNENLLFLDADTIITPDLFEIYLSKIIKYNAVVGIYNFESLNKNFFQEIKSFYYYFMLYREKDYKYSIFSSSCAGIKKSYFKKINGFDNWFGLNKVDYENEDFGRRLSKITSIWMAPDMQVYHYFPENIKLFKTLFLRTSHWFEDFYLIKDKQFDEAGGTKAKGLKCILSFLILKLLFINFFFMFDLIPLTIFLILISISLLINWKFLTFVKKKNKSRLNFFLGLVLFDSTIVAGAFYGAIRMILKISKFQKK